MVEAISYEVLKKLGQVEIRKYPLIVAARVDGYGDGGFNLLFNFISGRNSKAEKVAMTAPVVSEKIAMTAPVLSEGGSISFVMPEGYTKETTPRPLDARVKIVDYPPRYLATLRFSGRWTNRAFESRSREMMNELQKAGIEPKGVPFSMRYNAPFTPWFMRRNEVAVEVSYPV